MAQVDHVAATIAAWVAERIVECANDNGDDPLTYATDTEVVNLYVNDISKLVSEKLPNAVREIVKR